MKVKIGTNSVRKILNSTASGLYTQIKVYLYLNFGNKNILLQKYRQVVVHVIRLVGVGFFYIKKHLNHAIEVYFIY